MSGGFWTGAGALASGIRAASQRKTDGARHGMMMALLNVLSVSNAQVPFEEGWLQEDGEASMADGDQLLGAVSYGRDDETKEYAVVQHEDMSLRHDPGRNAKFLENAFNSTRDESAEIIAKAIRERLKS